MTAAEMQLGETTVFPVARHGRDRQTWFKDVVCRTRRRTPNRWRSERVFKRDQVSDSQRPREVRTPVLWMEA